MVLLTFLILQAIFNWIGWNMHKIQESLSHQHA